MDRSMVEALLRDQYEISPDVVGAILDACLPAARMRLVPATGADLPIRSSRFGGEPDLPRHAPWPRRASGRFLTFVAQINLAECASYLEPFWPREGLLSIFYDAGDAPMGEMLEDHDSFRLLYYEPNVELMHTPRPKPIRDLSPSPRPKLDTYAIKFEGLLTCPAAHTLRTLTNISQVEEKKYGEFYTDQIEYGVMASECHLLGGHAFENWHGGAQHAACGRAGISPDHLPDTHPARREFDSLAAPWRLFAQFDSDENLQHDWNFGDDRLYIWIHGDSLRRWTFDRCWATVDVG
ncbi:MAG: DUF1963 domain-containing protein [Phycisphaeraceae bacterium]|nr:MAG: DUF1963 domain-containing protein [Phycisphaeraceae bacterium]